MKKFIAVLFLVALTPVFLYAQDFSGFGKFTTSVSSQILNPLLGLFMGIAVACFFWGLVKYVFDLGTNGGKESGKSFMIWSIVALAVMVGVYGLVNLVVNATGLNKKETISTPGVPGTTQSR